MWRSGTSLLYALLNQNPQIALLYEGDLPLLWPLFKNGKPKQDWLERWDFWNGAPRRHKIDINAIPANITDMQSATQAIYQKYAGLAIWGCKSPNYYDSMIELAEKFPQARFIIIWRDPRDIVRSIIRAGEKSSWFRKSGMPLRAILGCRELKKQCDTLLARGVPVHQIQYEEMVKDAGTAMMQVCKFLGIAFDSKMVSLGDADRSAIYSAEHHAMVKGAKIDPSRERKEVLPSRLQNKIERYIGFWHGEYGGNWPAVPAGDARNSPLASWPERGLDWLRYRTLRAFDQSVLYLYCRAPLGLLRKYRTVKRYHDGSVDRPVGKFATVAAVRKRSSPAPPAFPLGTLPPVEMSTSATSNQAVHRGAV
jgi:hypothetical protein